MKRILLLLAITFSLIFSIEAQCLADSVSGTIQWPLPNTGSISPLYDNSTISNVPVTIQTSSGQKIAESKTDANGSFMMTVPAGASKQVLIVVADTPTGVIRAVSTGTKTNINALTEALVYGLSVTKVDINNITDKESAIIVDRLLEIAGKINLSNEKTVEGTVQLLLDYPELILELTTLISKYGAPGDNESESEKIVNTMNLFLSSVSTNKTDQMINNSESNASIYISGEYMTPAAGAAIINDIHKNFTGITFDVEYLGLKQNGNQAVLTTFESLKMLPKQGGEGQVIDAWFTDNSLVRKNNKWIISERVLRQCKVAKAEIKPDGHISDWIGILPCYKHGKFIEPDEDQSNRISALYFAQDKGIFYWRMDLDAEKSEFQKQSGAPDYFPRGIYSINLVTSDSDEESCSNFINYITNEITSSSSIGRSCVLDKDGKEVMNIKTYNAFGVGVKSVEGSIPIAELEYVGNGMVAFGMGEVKTNPAQQPTNLFTDSIELFF